MIPNICHFIFGFKKQTEEFLFCYYMAVYSAYIINKPMTIYFYYYYEPYGKWWNELLKIPNIKLEKVEMPTHIGNKEIKKTAHFADELRLRKLYEIGGIYLDIDTICVKSWNHLLNNKMVLGKEKDYGICNAIMLSEKNSEFIKYWRLKYSEEFNPDGWNEASIYLPKYLSTALPRLVTVCEENNFFSPSYNEVLNIFHNIYDINDNLISLHLWDTFSYNFLKSIEGWEWAKRNSHTLYGKILLSLMDKL